MAENALDDILIDLKARLNAANDRKAEASAEIGRLEKTLATLQSVYGGDTRPLTNYQRITDYVEHSGRWMTHSEIVRHIVPDLSVKAKSSRHTIATQIGQLVQRGTLKQAGRLIGMPSWEQPPAVELSRDVVSGRNGRSSHIAAVLQRANRPLHIKDVCAELLRDGCDADERCVANALAVGAKALRPKWIKVGPALFQATNGTGGHEAKLG